jgi:O-antigen/teichoic acid export membrane protein
VSERRSRWAGLGTAERAALGVLGVRVVGAGLAYASQVVLARLLGTEAYGAFALAFVVLLAAGHGALFGLSQAACRFVPEHAAEGRPDLLRGFVRFGALCALASGAAIALTGIGLLRHGPFTLQPAVAAALVAAFLVVPAFAMQDFVEGVARGLDRPMLAIAPIYVLRQALIPLLAIAAVGFGWPADAPTALGATGLAVLVALAVQGTLVRRALRTAAGPASMAAAPRRWATASLPMALSDWTVLALSSIDVLLLAAFRPASEVALYFAATRLLQFAGFAAYAASAATAQRFAAAQARDDRAELRTLARRAARLTFLATGAIALGVLAAAPLLLGLFGPDFGAALPILGVLLAGAVLQAGFGPSADLLNMLGGERAGAAASLASLALAGLLCTILIPALGALGAALAMATAQVARAAFLHHLARHRFGFRADALAWA